MNKFNKLFLCAILLSSALGVEAPVYAASISKSPRVSALEDKSLNETRSFSEDVKLFSESASKLGRLCTGAFGENSYLDCFSNKTKILSNREVRTAFRFFNLFSRYYNRLDKISVKYEKIKKDENFAAYTLSMAAKVAMAHASADLMTFCKDKSRLHKILNEANYEFKVTAQQEEKMIKHALRPAVIAKIYKFRISNYEEAVGLVKADNPKFNVPSEIRTILMSHAPFMKGIIGEVLKKPALKFLTRDVGTDTVEQFEKVKSMLLGVTDSAYAMETGKRSIKAKDAIAFTKKLLPGDIIVNRSEANVTNMVLRGFWIHTMLYLGTPAEMDAYFKDDPKVQSLCRKYKADSFFELLQNEYPEAAARWITKDKNYDGAVRTIIEAMPTGVIISCAPLALNADHAAAMRPRLRKIDKAKAIMRAFSYFGTSYDLTFDFTSESSVVCTELVAKAYTADDPKEGLNFNMKKVYGLVMAIPSNIFVEKFATEFGTNKQELDFVSFLRGDRKNACTKYETEKAFLESYKWDDGLKSKQAY